MLATDTKHRITYSMSLTKCSIHQQGAGVLAVNLVGLGLGANVKLQRKVKLSWSRGIDIIPDFFLIIYAHI